MGRPHLDMVFKTTAIQKLIWNLKIMYLINMREKAPQTQTNYARAKVTITTEITVIQYRKNRLWITCLHIKLLFLTTDPPFHNSVSVPSSTPARLFNQATFHSPAIVRVDIPFCFWLHDLRGFTNHNWKLSMCIPSGNVKTKHFISISNIFLIHCWATKCTSFNLLTINTVKIGGRKSSVPS